MLDENTAQWTGNLDMQHGQMNTVREHLCQAFNHSPFFSHSGMQMRVVNDQIEGYIAMQPNLIGNVAFKILHGGVAATMLDSIGGIVAMAALYERSKPEAMADTMKQVSRLATVDMRVDYISAGRGAFYVARAEVLRLGRKGCTMRMDLHNDQQVLIATAIASYAY